jgi:4-hydroxythreonine-4-phosphate dehydrogenase
MTSNIIAITMGDPSGIGPEITAKVFSDSESLPQAIVIGDHQLLERTISSLQLDLVVRAVETPEQAEFRPGVIDMIARSRLPQDLAVGRVGAQSGKAAFDYVRFAIELALQGRVQAITTAPLNKEAMHAAGIRFAGHTEILADLTGTRDYAMMLVNEHLRVILVTLHVPLIEAVHSLSVERELATIRLAHRAVRQLGIERPRIAVAGLNPHAGEGGIFGREDAEIVAPAVELAVEEGIEASGPWPGDTIFMRARRGLFDIVVAQYHDQGLIPIKYLGINHGVNITVGLPFVRTSVDHGTAFDIAGAGCADPTSLRTALQLASQLVAREG